MSASIQVLTRAIQPLEILTRKDAPMCLAEITEASGLPKAAPIRSARPGSSCLPSASPVEYAAEGIRANALCPGQILTDMNVKRYFREAAEGCTPEETMRRAIATVPLGRFRLHDRAGAERHRGANHRALAFPPLPSFRMAFPRRPLSPFFSAFLSVFRASSTSKRRAAQ